MVNYELFQPCHILNSDCYDQLLNSFHNVLNKIPRENAATYENTDFTIPMFIHMGQKQKKDFRDTLLGYIGPVHSYNNFTYLLNNIPDKNKNI